MSRLYGLKDMDECGYCGIVRDEPCSRFCSRESAMLRCSTAISLRDHTGPQVQAAPRSPALPALPKPAGKGMVLETAESATRNKFVVAMGAPAFSAEQMDAHAAPLVATIEVQKERLKLLQSQYDSLLQLHQMTKDREARAVRLGITTPGKSACGECGRVCEPCSDFCGSAQVLVPRKEIRA